MKPAKQKSVRYYEDFVVSSFDHAQIQTAKKERAKIRTGMLINEAPPDLVEFAEWLGAWSLRPAKRCVTPEMVADAHRRKLKVFVFTINQPSAITSMAALGVEGVFMDYPDRVVTSIHSQSKIIR